MSVQDGVTRGKSAKEAAEILRDKYQELRDGMRPNLPWPLREAFYQNLLGVYDRAKFQVLQSYINAGMERGNKALGEALATMQQLYADALRSYQEGMDVVVTGGLIDDSPVIPKSDEPIDPPLPIQGARRKRGGGL